MKSFITVIRKFLPFIYVFIVIHFLKDITQDILRVSTFLDFFGDAKEDLSFLPYYLQIVYLYGLGIFSFLVEAFLLIAIPMVLRRKKLLTLEKLVFAGILYLVVFFITATFLDPRYRFWR